MEDSHFKCVPLETPEKAQVTPIFSCPSSPLVQHLPITTLLSASMDLPLLRLWTNRTRQNVTFPARLLSLCLVFSKFISVVAQISTSVPWTVNTIPLQGDTFCLSIHLRTDILAAVNGIIVASAARSILFEYLSSVVLGALPRGRIAESCGFVCCLNCKTSSMILKAFCVLCGVLFCGQAFACYLVQVFGFWKGDNSL